MGDHPVAAMMKAFYDSAEPGDMSGFRDRLADDVVWHMIGGDTITGAEEVLSSMSGLSEVDFQLNMHDVISNDDHAVALLNVAVQVGDQSFEYRTAEIYHINADGKITERWAFSDDTAAITAFFAQFG